VHEHSSDTKLLKAIARKDTAAFKVFMSRYQERVYRTVYRFIGDAEATRDLVQDIFLKVYRAAASYTPDAGLFSWLYRITANHCITFLQKQKRDPLFKSEESLVQTLASANSSVQSASPESTLVRQEWMLRVRRAIDSLPQRQKMAITLLRFEGLSYLEISEVLGCSVSAVESLVFRGMETLKKLLLEEESP
jgi:RNA polymerase sigma-70 factor (ECF subfamily)